MKPTTSSIFICTIALLVGRVAAVQAAQFNFGDTLYQSAVAGQTGDNYRQFRDVSPGRAIAGLRVAESRDTPCRYKRFIGDGEEAPTENILEPLDCRNTRGDIEIQFGVNTFLYKLQICTNDSANPERRRFVKGLRGWGRQVLGPEQLVDVGAALTDEQPNCRNNWDQNGTAECLAGQVASDVIVHTQSHDRTGWAIVGFSLKCLAVEWDDQESDDQESNILVRPGRVRPGKVHPGRGGAGVAGDTTVTGDLTVSPTGGSGKPVGERPTGVTRPPRTGGTGTGSGATRPTGGKVPSTGSLGTGGAGDQNQGAPSSGPATGNAPEPSVRWTSPSDWFGPTGNQGTQHHRWVADPERALTSLIFRENGDDPVHVEFVGKKLCADSECASYTDHTFRVRPGNLTSQRSIWVGELHYAVALRACTSRSGKLKGLKMWGARIRPNGTLEHAQQPAEFDRPNCSDWGPKIQCGANQVVAGLWLHEDRQKGFVGISIKCGRVAMN